MREILQAFEKALELCVSLDPALLQIVKLSLGVSGSALACAALLGIPLGAWLAVSRFRGRRALVVLLNAGMGLPPVVVGLVVYLALSRSGPLGGLGLLFTAPAMVIAQALLILPIVAALTRQTLEDLHEEYRDELRSFGATRARSVATLLVDGRHRLATALLAGFGRASAEVGAVIIVGGNIAHHTRTMTTAIALETSRGELALALALGLLLLALSLSINAAGTLAADAVRATEGRV